MKNHKPGRFRSLRSFFMQKKKIFCVWDDEEMTFTGMTEEIIGYDY